MKYIIRVITKRGEYTTGIKSTSAEEFLKKVDTVKKINIGEIKTLELATSNNVVIYIPKKVLKKSVIMITELGDE
jgi:hypothetical protein